MDRRSLCIDELERLCDIVQAPLGCLLCQTLPLDVPAQRAESLGSNIDICISLNSIQDLHDSGMA